MRKLIKKVKCIICDKDISVTSRRNVDQRDKVQFCSAECREAHKRIKNSGFYLKSKYSNF